MKSPAVRRFVSEPRGSCRNCGYDLCSEDAAEAGKACAGHEAKLRPTDKAIRQIIWGSWLKNVAAVFILLGGLVAVLVFGPGGWTNVWLILALVLLTDHLQRKARQQEEEAVCPECNSRFLVSRLFGWILPQKNRGVSLLPRKKCWNCGYRLKKN